MRVLLAIDGSPQSGMARDLVASLAWPEGTRIIVVGVVEPTTSATTGLIPYVTPDVGREVVVAAVDAHLADVAAALRAPGRVVEARRLHGRPASVIVDQAATIGADLIVVGSRGFGPLRSMLLGSVSAEVVDHASCPVLVVRTPSVGSILLAVDGSTSAARALQHLCGARHLAGHRVEVLTVSPLLHEGILATDRDSAAQADRRQQAEAEAEAAAAALRRSDLDARPSVAVGNAAEEIILAARDLQCDLIVMGSRGLTRLERIRVGSVARNVLMHTHASVLIVRETVHGSAVAAAPDRSAPAEPELVGVGSRRETVAEGERVG